MFKKRYFIILLLFLIIAIGAISQVSASDFDVDDEIVGDASIEEVSAEELTEGDLPSTDLAEGEEPGDGSNTEIPEDEPSEEDPIVPQITLSQSGTTSKNKTVTVKVVDSNSGLALNNTQVALSILNSKGTVVKSLNLTTDENGQASSKISLGPGIYSVKAIIDSTSATLSNFKITKPVKITATKLTTIYKSTKKFKVKVVDEDNKAVSGVKVKIRVYTGTKYKTYTATTNSNGLATLKVSAFKRGKHKVLVFINDTLYPAKKVSSSIKLNPRPVVIKAVSVTDKEFGALAITVKDKTLKKYVDGIPVKLLVYTGKKYKTYKLSTSYIKDEKQHGGIMYLANMFSVGKHKVKIVAYGNYKGTKYSKITIRKSAKKNPPIYAYTKKGKLVVYVKYNGKWIKA